MVEQIYRSEVSRAGTVAATDTSTEIYKVTSGKTLELDTVILTNLSGMTKVSIYDCQSSATSGKRVVVIVGASDTKTLDRDDCKAIDGFLSSVVAYTETTSGVFIALHGTEF